MHNMSFYKQATPFSSLAGGGIGSLAGGGVGAFTGTAIADLLGASGDNRELGMQLGGAAGLVGGGLLGAKMLGPLVEKALARRDDYGWEDDVMNAADHVRNAMSSEGLDGMMSQDDYRREFEKRFNSLFQEPLSQEQREFVQRYLSTKSAGRNYNASQMLGLLEASVNVPERAHAKEAAKWDKIFRGIGGNNGQREAVNSMVNNMFKSVAGDHSALLTEEFAKYIPKGRAFNQYQQNGIGLLKNIRGGLTGIMDAKGNNVSLKTNAKGEMFNPMNGERIRGGWYDRYMNYTNLMHPMDAARKTFPSRLSVTNKANEKSLKNLYNSDSSVQRETPFYHPGRNLVVDASPEDVVNYISSLPFREGMVNFAGLTPSEVRHGLRRHEAAHWRALAWSPDKLRREARESDVAIRHAARTSRLKLPTVADKGIRGFDEAINEGFINAQAAKGSGYSARRFRAATSGNPEFGWERPHATNVPDSLLYRGRSGITQMAMNYETPFPKSGYR